MCLFKHSSSEQREKNFAWDGGGGGTIVSEYLYRDTLASKVHWIFFFFFLFTDIDFLN